MYWCREYYATNNSGNYHGPMWAVQTPNDDGNASWQLLLAAMCTYMVRWVEWNDNKSSRWIELSRPSLHSCLATIFPICLWHLYGSRCMRPGSHCLNPRHTKKKSMIFVIFPKFVCESIHYTNLMKKNVSTLYAAFVMVWNQNSFSTSLRNSILSAYLKTMMHVWPGNEREFLWKFVNFSLHNNNNNKILKNRKKKLTQNHPSHRKCAKSMDRWNGIIANASITNRSNIANNRERQQ